MLVIYERFIEIKPLEDEINSLEISSEEKNNLLHMSAELLHHQTMDTILDRLDEENKKKFLEAAHLNQEIKMAEILKEKISDYEKVLKEKLVSVRDEIIDEIGKAKL